MSINSLIIENKTKDNNFFFKVLLSLLCLIFLRILLEAFSNPAIRNIGMNPLTLLSFTTFYIAVFLSTIYVYKRFTGLPIKQITTFSLVSFSVILIPPVWDLIFTGGYCLAYTMDTAVNLIKIFFTMGSHAPGCGISWGMRVAVIITLVLSFLFIRRHTKHRYKTLVALLGSIVMYSVILFQGAWLSIIGTLYEYIQNLTPNTGASWLLLTSLKTSFFATHHGFTLTDIWNSKQGESFSLFMMRLHILSIFVVGWFIIKNSFQNIYTWFSKILPWKRIFMFIFFSVIGMVLADKLIFTKIIINPINISGFIILCLAFVFHGITAIIVNDVSDYELDTIAHPERPLPSGLISPEDYKTIGTTSFVLGVLSTISLNYTVTIFLIAIQCFYYLYAVEPFRLKKHWIFGLFVYLGIGMSVLAVGYFFAAKSQVLIHAPWKIFTIIAAVFSITAFQKDIPDAFADKQFNILSIPVFLGEKLSLIISVIITPTLFGYLAYFFHSWLLGMITSIFTLSIVAYSFNYLSKNIQSRLKNEQLRHFVNIYIIGMSVFFLGLILVIIFRI